MTPLVRAFFATSLACLVAMATLHAWVLVGQMGAWPALIHLTLFGWLTGMIFAVNYHTMPVFTARDFPVPALLRAHLATFALGVTATTAALLLGQRGLSLVGLALQGSSALLFVANTLLLLLHGRPRPHRPPTPPIPDQAQVDRLATRATQSAALCLPLALLGLLLVRLGWLGGGWWLAAEHLATLGWLTLMIAGVAYHVLPRFSGHGVRGARWVRLHLCAHLAALVLMIPALGFGWSPLFAAGGLLMAAAVALFGWTVWPALRPHQPRPATIPLSQIVVEVRL